MESFKILLNAHQPFWGVNSIKDMLLVGSEGFSGPSLATCALSTASRQRKYKTMVVVAFCLCASHVLDPEILIRQSKDGFGAEERWTVWEVLCLRWFSCSRGEGRSSLCQAFAELSLSQGAGEEGQIWTDHVKCEHLGRVHILPYGL